MADGSSMSASGLVSWGLFMATSVYGHVALKLATSESTADSGIRRAWDVATSPWTISGAAAWTISGLLWLLILDRFPLFEAMSISSLRYVLVALAAILILQEAATWTQLAGMILIAGGIFLIKHGQG